MSQRPHASTPMDFRYREQEQAGAVVRGRPVAYLRWRWVFSCPECGREVVAEARSGGRVLTPRCKGQAG